MSDITSGLLNSPSTSFQRWWIASNFSNIALCPSAVDLNLRKKIAQKYEFLRTFYYRRCGANVIFELPLMTYVRDGLSISRQIVQSRIDPFLMILRFYTIWYIAAGESYFGILANGFQCCRDDHFLCIGRIIRFELHDFSNLPIGD